MSDPLHVIKQGSGPNIILLHGFPMHRRVWDHFSSSLSSSFTVYTPDLPGFGQSPLPAGDFSLESVAQQLNDWVASAGISNALLIGHSMGGYIALEMVRMTPSAYAGLGLFHSTALADSAEKKESRTKVIRFVDENGVLAFTSNFIQPLFADQNHPAIPAVKDITVAATAEAVKGYAKAMRDRRDNRTVIQSFHGPVLIIGGDSDKGIPAESLREQAGLNPRTTLRIFEQTGHMGMFEKTQESLEVVRQFANGIFTTGKA